VLQRIRADDGSGWLGCRWGFGVRLSAVSCGAGVNVACGWWPVGGSRSDLVGVVVDDVAGFDGSGWSDCRWGFGGRLSAVSCGTGVDVACGWLAVGSGGRCGGRRRRILREK
jgi:hypothetical protein